MPPPSHSAQIAGKLERALIEHKREVSEQQMEAAELRRQVRRARGGSMEAVEVWGGWCFAGGGACRGAEATGKGGGGRGIMRGRFKNRVPPPPPSPAQCEALHQDNSSLASDLGEVRHAAGHMHTLLEDGDARGAQLGMQLMAAQVRGEWRGAGGGAER